MNSHICTYSTGKSGWDVFTITINGKRSNLCCLGKNNFNASPCKIHPFPSCTPPHCFHG